MSTTNNHRRRDEGCSAIKLGDRCDRLSSIVRLPAGDMEPWAATESEINTEIRDEKANSS
jgi:hypothetical protein